MVLNYMWNWNFSEVVILTPKIGSVILHAYELILRFNKESVHFPESHCYIETGNVRGWFYSVSKCAWKDNFKN